MDRLTESQAAFAKHYVANGGSATDAAKAAGYSEKNAAQLGWQQLQKPNVLAAIRAEQQRALGSLATKALRVLESILTDKDAPAGVRVDAAKTILDRAGLGAQRSAAVDAPPLDRPMSEWSLDQLAEFIARAKPVAGNVIDQLPPPAH
jgi:phage terminase small subunit